MIGVRRITGSRICAAHGLAQAKTATDADVIIADAAFMAVNVTRNRHRRPTSAFRQSQPIPPIVAKPSRGDRDLIRLTPFRLRSVRLQRSVGRSVDRHRGETTGSVVCAMEVLHFLSVTTALLLFELLDSVTLIGFYLAR